MKLNLHNLKAINEVFESLCALRRWTSFVTEDKYNELAKQSLNCIVAYLLASYSEHEGVTVTWDRFPKIALYRAFQKVYVYFDTPEHIIKEICELGNIKKDAFTDVTKEIIVEQTDEEFANFICEGIGTYEFRIYRAATKIATTIELLEISKNMKPDDFSIKYHELDQALKEFDDIPGIHEMTKLEGNVFNVLQKISSLRNKNRWASHVYAMECSVLGHLFDTAVFAYLLSLEEKTTDTAYATTMFFGGIWHDVAETWTTDIPSPIKDRIKGFRKATEEYELKKLEEELYSKVPKFLEEKLHLVMIEELAGKDEYKLLKGADYLSADSECYRQYRAGSRDDYFLGAMYRRIPKIESGEVALTPVCHELYNYFVSYAERLNL